jgi:Cytochrome C'
MTRTRIDWSSMRTLALCLGGTALLLSGCNASVEKPPSSSLSSTTKPVDLTAAPVVSVNALMVAWVDNSGHVLWNAEREGHAPKNDADWLEIQEHATQLAAAGTLIQLGGTGQADLGWARLPDWKTNAQKLSNAALDALTAAKSKDLQALIKANGQLAEACENCHKEFKPNLPTEGVAHHPPHEH